MQAKILTQPLLQDDDMKTESQVSIEKMKSKLSVNSFSKFSVNLPLIAHREPASHWQAEATGHLHKV